MSSKIIQWMVWFLKWWLSIWVSAHSQKGEWPKLTLKSAARSSPTAICSSAITRMTSSVAVMPKIIAILATFKSPLACKTLFTMLNIYKTKHFIYISGKAFRWHILATAPLSLKKMSVLRHVERKSKRQV